MVNKKDIKLLQKIALLGIQELRPPLVDAEFPKDEWVDLANLLVSLGTQGPAAEAEGSIDAYIRGHIGLSLQKSQLDFLGNIVNIISNEKHRNIL